MGATLWLARRFAPEAGGSGIDLRDSDAATFAAEALGARPIYEVLLERTIARKERSNERAATSTGS